MDGSGRNQTRPKTGHHCSTEILWCSFVAFLSTGVLFAMQARRADSDPRFTNRRVKSVTFQGKLEMPIHRWYRLTPSFAPQLAHDIADYFSLNHADRVLDPFSGTGTVPLCMKYRGVPACSIELNPCLHFVGTVKTRTYSDLAAAERCVTEFLAELRGRLRRLPDERDAARYLREHEQE